MCYYCSYCTCITTVLGNDLEEAPCFCRCVKQLVFGFFSATDDGAKQHTAHFTKKMPNFYQGAKRELCKYLIENFSFPEAIILDMTDFQGNVCN